MDHPRATAGPAPRSGARALPSPLFAPLADDRPHSVSVVHRGSFAVATCADCDWTGRARRAVANAHEDADLHRNLGAGL